ncbi:hypothetical protein VZT92_025799 [Zoarces viviparus]|uniref:Uncharacterized protein n=1 Tax=Zoarces viviparus TaxID=48416 RepID=A0AAW1E051_ZOAVI
MGVPFWATTSLTGERVAGTGTSLSDWTGGHPQWAGIESRGAGREGRRCILFGLVHHLCPLGGPPSRLSNSPLANLS